MERRSYFIFLHLFIISFQYLCPAISIPSLATDQSALLALKTHITLDPHGIITSNWTNSITVCTWIGVTCGSHHRRVTALNMSYMGVDGAIPPHLGNLSFLISLELQFNNFSGNLPLELSRLHRLKFLSLYANNFTGEIPSWLGHLNRLTYLSLRNNSFTGVIPNSIGNLSNIYWLDFTYNSLYGPIPEQLGNLHRLQYLIIQNNNLSGPIPSAIFNMSMLKSINLAKNDLNGNLPINMCHHLPFVERISLNFNHLSGLIPSNLSECSQLRFLSLSYNLFSGEIPREVSMLKQVETLQLGGNYFHGSIPQEIGTLKNLVYFSIEKNRIIGDVPINIFNISTLEILYFMDNNLTGSLPREIRNLTSLKELALSINEFHGVLPQEICQLAELELLTLDYNYFDSPIPQGLFNISTLRILGLGGNGFRGSLPRILGYGLPALEELYLSQNNFIGAIPNSISNCSKLIVLSLGWNELNGTVPHSLGSLQLLQILSLNDNNLTTESSSLEISFITSLQNCLFLVELSIANNPFNGIIPTSIGNLSTSLLYFNAYNCKIKGIPAEIGNLSNLVKLNLQDNPWIGNIPLSIMHLHNLQGLYLGGNKIGGSIPKGWCNLKHLGDLYLSRNQFSSSIPECLGNITSLRYLFLDSNMLNSSIPSSIWFLQDILALDFSANYLSGVLPLEVSNLAVVVNLNLSMNQFSGDIPNTIGKFENLANLSLEHNNFKGIIPMSMGNLTNLEALDLSYNNLSGPIPMSLQELKSLEYLNVSFNALTGEIPTGGPFSNFTMESFKGNKGLCGIAKFHVPPCHIVTKHRSRRERVPLILFIVIGLFGCILVVCLSIIFIIRYKRKGKTKNRTDVMMPVVPERISYFELLRATEQFDESNLLGIGSFGSVYKGIFTNGNVLAVKVFNVQLENAFKSFDVECEVLRSIRHRNLTKVMGSCSNEDFKALVLEYMPNGSLEKFLYSHNYCLDVEERLNIMIDVASALEYLHHGCSIPIVHCDLKPSNVLLDEEMVAHVSDFGIAKLLGEGESIVHTNTLATLGYIAPEYGLEGLVSTRCDVYSYGIMLMETFTRKRPSEEMFARDMSIKTWVEGLFHESSSDVIDPNLLNPENLDRILHCVLDILKLALKCSAESPGDRIHMTEALADLQKIKRRLFA